MYTGVFVNFWVSVLCNARFNSWWEQTRDCCRVLNKAKMFTDLFVC